MNPLLDYHDALDSLLETHAPLYGEEQVPLDQLNRRVLAQDMLVQYDVPAFDNSAMDGYAISGNDCGRWEVVHRIAAGDPGAQSRLERGQAARIFTGAPVPQGTTAVLMQENIAVDSQAGTISLIDAHDRYPIEEGLNIRYRAAELRSGTHLLRKHQRLSPAAIGLLAAQGYTHAPCVPALRITIFSSGNELVEAGEPLREGAIYDSNRHMLVALLREQGFTVTDGGILPDQLPATRNALRAAAIASDAIICSGGVSVGEEDHLKAALSEEGELTQWRLRIKPGKPFTWGHIGTCRVFMLPGNPVSSLVTFQQLAMPALQRLAGLPKDQARPWQLKARAGFGRSSVEPRREFLRVRLEGGSDGYRAVPLQQQGSAMLSGVAFADALAEIPPGEQVSPGQELTVYPLRERF